MKEVEQNQEFALELAKLLLIEELIKGRITRLEYEEAVEMISKMTKEDGDNRVK